jgi:hypothetical protein
MEGDAKGEKRPEIRERRTNRSRNCEKGQLLTLPSPQLSFGLAVSDAPFQERSELLDKIPSTEQSFGSTRCSNSWRVPLALSRCINHELPKHVVQTARESG